MLNCDELQDNIANEIDGTEEFDKEESAENETNDMDEL